MSLVLASCMSQPLACWLDDPFLWTGNSQGDMSGSWVNRWGKLGLMRPLLLVSLCNISLPRDKTHCRYHPSACSAISKEGRRTDIENRSHLRQLSTFEVRVDFPTQGPHRWGRDFSDDTNSKDAVEFFHLRLGPVNIDKEVTSANSHGFGLFTRQRNCAHSDPATLILKIKK